MVVVACNAATSAGLPDLQEALDGARRRRDHARGARRRAGDAQPLRRPARDGGDGRAGRYDELIHALDAGVSLIPSRARGSCR